MLYILTGEIQTGKTRWLTELIENLEQDNITFYGVIAPGIWIPSSTPAADANGYEKLGINNVLLPTGETVSFADRRDRAIEEGSFCEDSQSAKANMMWHIHDSALDEVNSYLSKIPDALAQADKDEQAILIIDELGQLELKHNAGLTEAVKLLEAGPKGNMQDALVVARESLADLVERRFAAAWGGSIRVSPAEPCRCCGSDEPSLT